MQPWFSHGTFPEVKAQQLLQVVVALPLAAVGLALACPLRNARCWTQLLLNRVPKASFSMNPGYAGAAGATGAPTKVNTGPAWDPTSSGDRNVECAGGGLLGSGTGPQSLKPPGGILLSFLELALVLKVGLGPAKLPLSCEPCKRLLESAAFPLSTARLVPEISLACALSAPRVPMRNGPEET